MSGRAGRRGLDDKGVVVLMLDGAPRPFSPTALSRRSQSMNMCVAPRPAEKMEPAVSKEMVQGKPDALYSSFHLTYAMILNLVRSETASPEALMRASFRQFQARRPARLFFVFSFAPGESDRDGARARFDRIPAPRAAAQTERALPQLKARLEEIEGQLAECAVEDEEQVADYLFLQARGHADIRGHIRTYAYIR